MLSKLLVGLSLTASLFLIVAGCGNVTAAGDKLASLGQEFTLPVGQSVSISGQNLVIKFEAVTADSRCPRGAQCIWAGEASCQLQVCYKGENSTLNVKESGGTSGYTVDSFKEYKIKFQVQPYPEVGNHPAAGDYKLLMMIEKA